MILTARSETSDRLALADRVARYLAACPPAISGAGGHSQTFFVACKLINGFQLTESDALSWLEQYNQRCDPPWTQKELEHKVREATKATHEKPPGHMLDGHKPSDCTAPRVPAAPQQPAAVSAPQYDPHQTKSLPDPLQDGAYQLLSSVFGDDDGVSICPATLNAEGRCIPAGSGTVHSRREWLDKLDAVGNDANELFPPAPGGVFVRINPLKLGGSKDTDVTAYRHALVEFDNASMLEQYNIITQSGVPTAAILTSGNRSLHAWVKVDAKDAVEYASRVTTLLEHFKSYGVDVKNRNPSRFSRLPGVRRGESEQQLLQLGGGAANFPQWLADVDAAGIGDHFTISDLLDFKPSDDDKSVLGNRWLCEGSSCLWVGQSGIGKSSLAMQAAILWSLGQEFMGVKPAKPLRSLFIQGENDLGDTAEMLCGVIDGLDELRSLNPATLKKQLEKNIVIIRDQSHTGLDFAMCAQKLINKFKPDLVWVDPLFSFFGDDVSNQKACSGFLRGWLNPISTSTGIVWMLLHHTSKPSKDPKAYGNWSSNDWSYMGTGSAELVNWTRAAVFLKGVDGDKFKLMFTKRGTRAGATDMEGVETTDVYVEHSSTGICWHRCEPVAEAGKTTATLDDFLEQAENLTVQGLRGEVEKFFGCARSTAFNKVKAMKAKGMIRIVPGTDNIEKI
jgi:RecA-family ATPase